VRVKPIVQRSQAHADVEKAIGYYLEVANASAALGFVDALETGYSHVAQNPATGSPRYAHELNLPGLRAWPLTKYPYLIFYVELDQHIDVWRVLHMATDIPNWMTQD
jgi:toxin ParE1/3/4